MQYYFFKFTICPLSCESLYHLEILIRTIYGVSKKGHYLLYGDVISRYKINLTMPVPQDMQYWQIFMWPSIKSSSYPHFWDRFLICLCYGKGSHSVNNFNLVYSNIASKKVKLWLVCYHVHGCLFLRNTIAVIFLCSCL